MKNISCDSGHSFQDLTNLLPISKSLILDASLQFLGPTLMFFEIVQFFIQNHKCIIIGKRKKKESDL